MVGGPIVETTEGKLRGCVGKNFDGEEFYSFLGIPYAKPPIGELRFKDPHPLEPWSGIKDAVKEGDPCYQRDVLISMTKLVYGTEDCLHLNIFTKKPIPEGSKLNPVMVWIHGGGFREGSNTTQIYGPEFLMLEDIVLVSINYRLGLLGALKLEDPSFEIHGNAGMKDQVAALKWIQRNIRNFGGNPNNVTLFGESAGGASVQYLIVSPAAKGLFHKAIIQSGAITNKWAYGYPFLNQVLASAGKKNLSEKEALEFLKCLPLEEILRIQEENTDVFEGSFAPVAENPNPTAFITKHPFEYLISGEYNKVPIMMGYCSVEMLFLKALCSDKNELAEQLEKYNPEYCVNTLTNIKDAGELKKFGKKLRDFYGKTESGHFEMLTDVYVAMGVIGCAAIHAETSEKPVYLYTLSLNSGRNYVKIIKNMDDPGVSHLDDIGYLFKTTLPLPQKQSPEDGYVRRFVKLWTNFAKFGNPTPKGVPVNWKPVEKNTVNFLDIDKELIPGTDPKNEGVKIWREIFQANPLTAKYL